MFIQYSYPKHLELLQESIYVCVLILHVFSFHILGCLHTATVIGPFLGFLLASFCAKLFVDLESVDAGDGLICKILH